MTAETGFAPAKVNLTLHVTGQREDGYHLLDSLVAFADFGDYLTFESGPLLEIEVTGPFARGVPPDNRNLVWQAAELAQWTGRITLEKNIPHGAGLGGGSADAAAVLRHLKAPQFAVQLGADVPACLASQYRRMQGIGDRVSPLRGLPPLWAVLVNPNVQVSTPTVFRSLQQKQSPPMPVELPPFKSARELMYWLGEQRNDLERPAIAMAPVIDQVLKELSTLTDISLSRMSGSGSTCFGLFNNQGSVDLAVLDLRRAHPDWWVRDCVLS